MDRIRRNKWGVSDGMMELFCNDVVFWWELLCGRVVQSAQKRQTGTGKGTGQTGSNTC